MSDTIDLQQDVQSFLELMRPLVERLSKFSWEPSGSFVVPLLARSILRRQFESLEIITYLVAQGNGFAAPPLLRPSCEEFIWSKYLTGIPAEDANTLIVCMLVDEVRNSLTAQLKAAGPKYMDTSGLQQYLTLYSSNENNERQKMKELAKRLCWPKKNNDGCRPPSMSWLAGKTKELRVYTLIYHATSRFVHFSPHELIRRVWVGPSKATSINSKTFQHYWSYFSLYWGSNFFAKTILAALSRFPELWPDEIENGEEIVAAGKQILSFGEPPIITPQELFWPGVFPDHPVKPGEVETRGGC